MVKSDASVNNLFDLQHTLAADLLKSCAFPWEALPLIREFILSYGAYLDESSRDEYLRPSKDVWVHKDANIYASAYIAGPCIIGEGAEVRHSAFIRGAALVGKNCVVGNSTELKNVILFDAVEVPHYNYVGDSILGFHAHMGAGSITSNVKSDRRDIAVHFEDGDAATGLRKMGALIGDYAEIGCGSVLNPGSIVGKNSIIYPLSSVRGTVGAGSIYKKQGEIAERRSVT